MLLPTIFMLLLAVTPAEEAAVSERARLQALYERNALPVADAPRLARLKIEGDSRSAAEARERWTKIEAALVKSRAALTAIDSALPDQNWLDDVWIQRRQEASDPLAKELFIRVARDQRRLSVPNKLSGVDAEALWIARIPEIRPRIVENSEWLKSVLDRIGWFDISRFGASASQAAWLLVQHSDHDPAFQRAMIERLRAKVAAGEAQPRSLAYLVDRVAVNAGQLQTYGTQGRCVGPGDWQPRALVDAGGLDARRAAVGLEPIAAYRARFDCR